MTIILEDNEKYNDVSIDGVNGSETAFHYQMLIVYKTSALNHCNLTLKSMDLQEGKGSITIQKKKVSEGIADTCMRYQRWMVVRQGKMEGLSQIECKGES